jgi:hypothetical protein
MPKKITIFQMEDIENSPKTIDIHGSSLSVVYIPRIRLKEYMEKLNEFKHPGVYILKSDSESGVFSEKVYIGEGEPLKDRISQHISNDKNEFKECVIITSTRENELTKAHIKNMESKLFEIAINCKNAEVDNTNRPTKSSISLADESYINDFIEQIKIILPLCGFNCFIPTTIITDNLIKDNIFTIIQKNIKAEMVIEQGNYIVLKGSRAKKDTTSNFKYHHTYKELRDRLINNNILMLENDEYVFQENTVFTSSSAASTIVLGYPISGLEAWKNNQGEKLKNVI